MAGVVEVVVGVEADEVEVGGEQGAADLAGDSGDEGVGGDVGALGNEGSGGDDSAGADVRAVEDDGTDTDEDVVFEGAAVDGGVVADGAAVADDYGVKAALAVEDGAVLDVGAGADADGVHVAAEDGVHPDGGLGAEMDVADDLGGGVDVAAGGEGGGEAAEGANHAASVFVLRERREASGGGQIGVRLGFDWKPGVFVIFCTPNGERRDMLKRSPLWQVGRCIQSWQKFVFKKASLWKMLFVVSSGRCRRRTLSKRSSATPFT